MPKPTNQPGNPGTHPEPDLDSVVGRLEDSNLDLSQRVAFLEMLLDLSIRTTERLLPGHTDIMIATLDYALDTIDPASAYEAREFIIRHCGALKQRD